MTSYWAVPCQSGDAGNKDDYRYHKKVSSQGDVAHHTNPKWVLAQRTGDEKPDYGQTS